MPIDMLTSTYKRFLVARSSSFTVQKGGKGKGKASKFKARWLPQEAPRALDEAEFDLFLPVYGGMPASPLVSTVRGVFGVLELLPWVGGGGGARRGLAAVGLGLLQFLSSFHGTRGECEEDDDW